MSIPRAQTTVVIAGGGPVGLTLAALILRGHHSKHIKVQVLESKPTNPWQEHDTDLRVYALSRASQRILASAGAWQTMQEMRVSPYRRMHVWEGAEVDGHAGIEFDSADIGQPDLGHIVEDSVLRTALQAYIVAAPNAELTMEAELASMRATEHGVSIDLKSGETIHAQLLAAADGGASRVRTLLDIPIAQRDYRQRAIVTHVNTERPHAQTAVQRFLPGGPWAMLPLVDGRSSVVWSMPCTQADRLIDVSDQEFLAALQVASAGVFGELGPISERGQFPLRLIHAMRYCSRGVVLVGDAAHSVHPLAGQGMNLGLLDAACLAEEIDAACRRGAHLGDLSVLRSYERRRKAENLKMMLAFDAIDRLFRLPEWLAPIRALGLGAVNCAPGAKEALMRQALGLDTGFWSTSATQSA